MIHKHGITENRLDRDSMTRFIHALPSFLKVGRDASLLRPKSKTSIIALL